MICDTTFFGYQNEKQAKDLLGNLFDILQRVSPAKKLITRVDGVIIAVEYRTLGKNKFCWEVRT